MKSPLIYLQKGTYTTLVIAVFIVSAISVSIGGYGSIPTASAAVDSQYSDPTSSSFKIVVCDGPAGAKPPGATNYKVCDFNGLMDQIQHLINIMMVIGVFASIGAFSWAGALYISGNPEKKKRAHAIFPKIFFGFIIMLSAWFIVYQVLSWLTSNAGFKTLLGNPS